MSENSPYEFIWSVDGGEAAYIQRLTTIERKGKSSTRVLGVSAGKTRLEIYISPTGKMRIFRGNKEMRS